MTTTPWFRAQPERAGGFDLVRFGDDHARLVMREPHHANNVRYSLEVVRSHGRLRARWIGDGEASSGLVIGEA